MEEPVGLPPGPPINMLPPTPAGLETLYSLCRKIYPDQVNPLQVTALLKYWLGGPDPLDYISMYANPGVPHDNIPPHWHYISFGLSDLHGDGRVHDVSGPDGISGFGFELTFRLKREPGETAPPTWPATLMQSLGKYVFQSGNNLCNGDHVSWHCALDNSESRIQHMLMTSDVQLDTVQTPFGSVDFVQIVGVCADELRAAQKWNGMGVLNMLSQLPMSGGRWHITDMRRGESLFDLDLNAHDDLERGFETDGSNLSGVSARCSWTSNTTTTTHYTGTTSNSNNNNHPPQSQPTNTGRIVISEEQSAQIKSALQKGLQCAGAANDEKTAPQEADGAVTTVYKEERALEMTSDGGGGGGNGGVRRLEGVHLVFNLEAGSLLPLAIRGRVRHGRHFTFKSVLGETAITMVAHSVTGTLVSGSCPYVAQGAWLQVLIGDDLAQDMAVTFQTLATPEALSLPKTFAWPDRGLCITIVADKC